VCHGPLDRPSAGCICPGCWAAVIPTPTLPWVSADITVGAAVGCYEGALRDIIHVFKYEGRRTLAVPLGALMREAGRGLLQDADYVVPVPLHPCRRMRRGFNQARDLARQLDRPVADALWRFRATPSQMSLDADARRTNVRDAFLLSPLCGPPLYAAPPIANRVVVLIDDVRTTGSTLVECAKVLIRAGAREVRALTVAYVR
jgi:ComF family protein